MKATTPSDDSAKNATVASSDAEQRKDHTSTPTKSSQSSNGHSSKTTDGTSKAVAALSSFQPEAPKRTTDIPVSSHDVPQSPMTISGVLTILKIRPNAKHLAELLGDFTDDRHGLEEWVAHLRNNLEEQLTYYSLIGAKAVLGKFCEWFDTHYRPAGENSKPAFTSETWAAYAASSSTLPTSYRKSSPPSIFEVSPEEGMSSVTEPVLRTDTNFRNLPTPNQKQDLSRMPVAFPGASRVRLLVDRYNRNLDGSLSSLCVQWADVERMYKRLKVLCPRGLVDSLVYSPRDVSVFVRKQDSFGFVVDVALCTQDRTHRSDVGLDGDLVHSCDNRVGVVEARMRAPDVAMLHPIVQDFVKDRVVETINCPTDNLCTIELAPTYNEKRIGVPKEVAASDLWTYHGHQRLKFDFDRSSDDQDLFASWLICMTLFERKTTEKEHKEVRQYLLDRYSDFENKNMTENVNYETMFRSKGPEYRSGRLSWPLIVGLCMAKNLKEELEPFQSADADLQSIMGTYCGMFTDAHFLCGGLAVALSTILCVVAGFAVTMWDATLLRLCAAVSVPCLLAVVTANFYYLRDPRPLAFLAPSDHRAPNLSSNDRDLAIRLLLNESCRRHFNGKNLSFTGETYTGTSKGFGYRFTYKDLRQLGFGFCCDSWGREHLRVPKTGALVRMERSDGDVDYFVRVEKKEEPKLLFQKPWYSKTTYPG